MDASHDDLPFAGLTPDCVFDALHSAGYDGDGRLLPLNSYENRVYQAWPEDKPPIVVKFYRNGRWTDNAILEEHAFIENLHAHDIPVVRPLLSNDGSTLHRYQGFRFAVFPRQGGRAPEIDDLKVLTRIGAFLGRMHAVGGCGTFQHRPSLDPTTFGVASRAYLLDHSWLPAALVTVWTGVVDQALACIEACYARAGAVKTLRLHGDCHLGNVLWTDDRPHFVDFDDARNGPAIQDLWMLLSGSPAEMQCQLNAILEGYDSFYTFDRRELYLMEALRTLRMLHHCAWLAQRWRDPAFPPAFPWFDTPRYWEDVILELREQIALMNEEPLR
ncbi:MAG: serine/threonine protein kinase [Burkholderiaceae bacterium]|jgi:Ser/Thr protein kinase RdoA (MazF antagonist)